ncbi:hypothetical protein JXQ31_08745 [candidate division KSB1 bacterium]|nr:hypothetical protein [candidate division KSB1 bacterium]
MRQKFSRHLFCFVLFVFLAVFGCSNVNNISPEREYNGSYSGQYLSRVAFPVGGIGAGMFCLEGSGAISHLSLRNRPDVYNEPLSFAAICIKGEKNIARVIEGPLPDWKYFGQPGSGNGSGNTGYGLPRFRSATFLARFPFAEIELEDKEIPLNVEITGWSPFIPNDADNSSLPVGSIEYRFSNSGSTPREAVFSYNSKNFMSLTRQSRGDTRQNEADTILPIQNGFILYQPGSEENPQYEGSCAIFVDDPNVTVDFCWFRGGWFDPLTMAWKNIAEGKIVTNDPVKDKAPGASLYVPFSLKPGEEKTIKVMFAWYVPNTDTRLGSDPENPPVCDPSDPYCCVTSETFKPWYAGRFKDVKEVAKYWRLHYDDLRKNSALFRDTFYNTTLPDEVIEAVAANLTILKSPTVLRQTDGRLWCFEGCTDNSGCCHGSCTHVWNYAQAIPHLFPALERTLRETEFYVSQDERGHQTFRSNLPIRPVTHTFHSAADGQLGGIIKVYREWRISGDTEWLKSLWPKVRQSLDFCIETWDPKDKGILEEPHHNTYDIEYWGPDGHCTSFYLGALTAAIKMGKSLGDDISRYEELLAKGREFMEKDLYDGEYFIQKIQWEGLEAPNPVEAATGMWNINYSPEALEILKKEGPKYQYGTGCLSDGVLGIWIARVCGLEEPIIDTDKVKSHLNAVHKYNLKQNLLDHANPQRPSYALGKDGGLLLCTWPKGGALTFPFVYSNEVWTGIEYQVASHLMFEGEVENGLEIVRLCRNRYDGRLRNPFNEYECGHWYARAMSSYGLLQGLTGVRYDAVDKTLYIDSKIGGNFTSFLSAETGFGTVGLKNGSPFFDMKMGDLDVKHVIVSGKEVEI